MGNEIGDMVNDMDSILPMAIYGHIAEIQDIDVVHGDTSMTTR